MVVGRLLDAEHTALVVHECRVWKRPPSMRWTRTAWPPASTIAAATAKPAFSALVVTDSIIFFAPASVRRFELATYIVHPPVIYNPAYFPAFPRRVNEAHPRRERAPRAARRGARAVQALRRRLLAQDRRGARLSRRVRQGADRGGLARGAHTRGVRRLGALGHPGLHHPGGDQPLGRLRRLGARPDVRHGLRAAARLQRAEAQLPAEDRERRAAHAVDRSEEHTSELQSLAYLVCRLLLEKKNNPADRRGGGCGRADRLRRAGCAARGSQARRHTRPPLGAAAVRPARRGGRVGRGCAWARSVPAE